MNLIKADAVLDCQGLSCPMPVVKTKQALDALLPGQVLEIRATDRGSLADIQAWAKNTGHHYLGTVEDGRLLVHYVRKADPKEVRLDQPYPHVVRNEELMEKLGRENTVVLDVREPAEYTFGHIPGALSIPLGELEHRLSELNQDDDIYVICRTGNRSDVAAKLLVANGFKHVWNVIPGMSAWQGPVERRVSNVVQSQKV